ncbi:unnamed protein product [Caenorhabditis angaria]|uniref:H/ACA ribonucleoprotein complex non-core subunit NAF1 n=1 Tax=Caenorhabditis angaria TaxID=860376 RepID=A0A9P1N4U6_9PELO|nr:unnamed protein product [Caenorhabditis angaria]
MEEDFVIDRTPIVSDATVVPKKPTEPIEVEPEPCPFQEMLPAMNEIRKAPSVHSYGGDTESEFDLSDDDSDFGTDFRADALDSDEEFDKLITISSKLIEKIHKKEYSEDGSNSEKKKQKELKKDVSKISHEYDDLPPLENLSITCQKSTLVEFGKVEKIVDCMVLIESTSNDVLDFDSYVFDEEGKAFGQIYDIFGQVKNPGYVVRFNTSEEASITPIGMKLYYAPDNETYSKTPFRGLNLAAANRETLMKLNQKLDRQSEIERKKNMIVGVDSDIEFSDDEAEKEFRNSKPQSSNTQGLPRENRKRDRRGGGTARVRFNNDCNNGGVGGQNRNMMQGNSQGNQFAPRPYQSWNWHNANAPRPYRRDFDGPVQALPNNSSPAPAATQALSNNSSDTNPYAEFGITDSFSGRFGV